jgi:hypothetical protein
VLKNIGIDVAGSSIEQNINLLNLLCQNVLADDKIPVGAAGWLPAFSG